MAAKVDCLHFVRTGLGLRRYCTQPSVVCDRLGNARILATALRASPRPRVTIAAKNTVVNVNQKMGTSVEEQVLPADTAHVLDGATALRDSQVIAVPTDTLYGFACDACSETAVQKIYAIKGRSSTRPLAICVAQVEDVKLYGNVQHLPQGLLMALFPGPVTLIVPRGDSTLLGKSLNPGLQSIGIRIPDDPFIRDLCQSFGKALALTSANLSSQPSAVAVDEFRHLWGHCAFVFDGGRLPSGRAGSTIVDLTLPGKFKIVRCGSALEETQKVLTTFGLLESSEQKM